MATPEESGIFICIERSTLFPSPIYGEGQYLSNTGEVNISKFKFNPSVPPPAGHLPIKWGE
jgi:hypothetical protein